MAVARGGAAVSDLGVCLGQVVIRRVIVLSAYAANDGADGANSNRAQPLAGSVHVPHPADIAENRKNDHISVLGNQEWIRDRQNRRRIDDDKIEVLP